MRNFINTITIGRVFGIRQDRTNIVTVGDKPWASSLSRYLSVRHVPGVLAAMHAHHKAAKRMAALLHERLRSWAAAAMCRQPVERSQQFSSQLTLLGS